MSEFTHDISIVATVDGLDPIELYATQTIADVEHFSRGVIDDANPEIPGTTGGVAGNRPDFLFVIAKGDEVKVELDNGDDMDVSLLKGQTFGMLSGKTFTRTTDAGDTEVSTDAVGLNTVVGGRGSTFEYLAVTKEVVDLCAIAAGTEGCDYFSFDYNFNGDWSEWGIEVDRTSVPTTDYWTVLLPDGNPLVLEPSVEQFAPSEEDTQEGTYCVYVSDENGNPVAGRWDSIHIFGRSDTSLDVTITNLDVSRVTSLTGVADVGIQIQAADLSDGLDLTHITTLVSLLIDDCILDDQEVLVNGILPFENFSADGCQSTKANTLTSLPNLGAYQFINSQLPSSEVDRVLNEIAASSTVTNGVIGMDNQTPAAPRTSASDAAVTDLEGRSPGWTITLDT